MSPAAQRSCGSCRLWSPNLFKGARAWEGRQDCCADTKMDLPSSWDNDREMQPGEGSECPIWEPRS